MREFLRFIPLLGLFSMLLAAILYFFIPSLPVKFRFNDWWKILFFFMVITSIFHYGLLKSSHKRATSITVYYMASTTIKLLLYVGIIIGYAMLHKETAPAFIITFFLMYFVYTAFEVGILYKKFSTPYKKDSI